MRTFTREEVVASGVCKEWRLKSEKLIKELRELKGKSEFTFHDVLTNSSIDDKEHDEIFYKMVKAFLGNGDCVDDFDKWFFGETSGDNSFLGRVGERCYREIIYTLVRGRRFERFLTEFKKWSEHDDQE